MFALSHPTFWHSLPPRLFPYFANLLFRNKIRSFLSSYLCGDVANAFQVFLPPDSLVHSMHSEELLLLHGLEEEGGGAGCVSHLNRPDQANECVLACVCVSTTMLLGVRCLE